MQGYLRQDGRKGIRNLVLVAYLVECAHHIARVAVMHSRREDVHLVGFPGCYHNDYAQKIMTRMCTHPNVGGVVLVSLGCEGFNRSALETQIRASGRYVETLIIQESGGSAATISACGGAIGRARAQADMAHRAPFTVKDLVVGTICGGSDGTSGLTANPSVGVCFDHLIDLGATCIFEETGELIGCEKFMVARAASQEVAADIMTAVEKAARYYTIMGQGSFAPGNAEGGLTTQEEKSLGAYAKSGRSKIVGVLKPGDLPPSPGLYLLDVVPDGEPRFGFPNISDNSEIVDLISCGAHVILFTTGRGSVVGSAISPVIKICANPETYRKLEGDMDVNAGRILSGHHSAQDVGGEILELVYDVAQGVATKSEALGHHEFLLTYKHFDAAGPGCHPQAQTAMQRGK